MQYSGWFQSYSNRLLVCFGLCLATNTLTSGQENEKADSGGKLISRPGLFRPLTEPPCSYCVNQNLKGLIKPDDVVLAWIRGPHNGGAFPLRYFISRQRVINDTYGLFFYDPDGGYVTAFQKDYGYSFHGWHGGVMIVRGKDGTIWNALSGRAISGPRKGKKLKRFPA